MENNNVSYLRTDDNKIINESCIRWVKKWMIVYAFALSQLGVR